VKAYIAQIRMNLRLTLRDRSVLFFSYLFPLGFLFAFGEIGHAEQGGAPAIVNMVLTIGVLGSGFFGAAMRAIGDRERNILRRFKVAPINAGPILVSSLVTGLVTYLPLVVLVLALAIGLWHMPAPANPVSLFLFLAIGVVAFRAMGGIIASVANSMQEGQVLVQLLYTPMLLLGGATIPLSIMPKWLQIASQFLPSTHFSSGLAGILLRQETLLDNLPAAGALLLTSVVATFLGAKLFRWDKDEKLKPGAKFWVLAVLAPFFAMGLWQAHAKTNLEKDKILARELNRNRTLLIRDVRLFVGNGEVLEQASVLIKDGKIAQVLRDSAPDAKTYKAETIEGAGKTLLPGLIDVTVHLGQSGAFSAQAPAQDFDRELAAYLYCGVTAVRSVGDDPDRISKLRASVESGEILGAEVFPAGSSAGAAGPGDVVRVVSGLTVTEAVIALGKGDTAPLERSLVAQVTPKEAMESTKKALNSPLRVTMTTAVRGGDPSRSDDARQRLVEAYRNGVTLAMGTDSGIPLVIHGPALDRELQLWVAAGIPPAVALQAATFNGARLLHADQRIGLIREGYDANLLLVDGNPLQDISATEHISAVIFRGERLDRNGLFKQE
jgi:ABC-type transport system involved in cytochrome c biogenesis permease component